VSVHSVQAFFGSPDTVVHIVEGAAILGSIIVGLRIQNAVARMELKQAETKAELLEHQQGVKDDLAEKHDELVKNQTTLKNDFDAKHAINQQQLAVHIAEDRGNFASIAQAQANNTQTLARIEGKVNGINGH
jgi:uncharacterized membrane-anchored protein YhcB (DUF1043 family)